MTSSKSPPTTKTAKTVIWADIQAYLDAIADHPGNQGDIESASHGRFWNVDYNTFMVGTVPHEDCNGSAIPNVDHDPKKNPLYQALINGKGWCQLGQMPLSGPFITDRGYVATLKDGSTISGADIASNILAWITNGMPET
jgi:hypothetical protein